MYGMLTVVALLLMVGIPAGIEVKLFPKLMWFLEPVVVYLFFKSLNFFHEV